MKTEDVKGAIFGAIDTELQGCNVAIAWQGKAFTPPQNSPWIRVFMTHTPTAQKTYSDEASKRLYTRHGILSVQVFWPISDAGFTNSFGISCRLRRLFQSLSCGDLWFNNCTAQEVGSDGPFYNSNFTAEFKYLEVEN